MIKAVVTGSPQRHDDLYTFEADVYYDVNDIEMCELWLEAVVPEHRNLIEPGVVLNIHTIDDLHKITVEFQTPVSQADFLTAEQAGKRISAILTGSQQ